MPLSEDSPSEDEPLNPATRKKLGFVRVLAGVVGIGLGLLVLVVGIAFFWFNFYSGGLPDMKALGLYTPAQANRVSDPCLGESTAIPYDAIGDNLRAALNAAEGNASAERQHQTSISIQISRSMFCAPSKTLPRELNEARTAAQLERRFSRPELLTIYANRARFGSQFVGVESASEYYFGKAPNQLGIGDAALLAGLLKGPAYYAPDKHPDRALQRRNAVVDSMVSTHSISLEDANIAEASAVTLAIR